VDRAAACASGLPETPAPVNTSARPPLPPRHTAARRLLAKAGAGAVKVKHSMSSLSPPPPPAAAAVGPPCNPAPEVLPAAALVAAFRSGRERGANRAAAAAAATDGCREAVCGPLQCQPAVPSAAACVPLPWLLIPAASREMPRLPDTGTCGAAPPGGLTRSAHRLCPEALRLAARADGGRPPPGHPPVRPRAQTRLSPRGG